MIKIEKRNDSFVCLKIKISLKHLKFLFVIVNPIFFNYQILNDTVFNSGLFLTLNDIVIPTVFLSLLSFD